MPLGRRSRRKTSWGAGPEDQAGTALAGSAAFLWNTALGAVEEPLTVMRIRGEWTMHLTAATALNDGYRGAVGIGIASLQAFTAGAASVPTPVVDLDSDNWLYHRFFTLRAPGPIVQAAVALSTDNAISSSLRVEIDSKAMRIIKDQNLVIYGAVEFTVQGSAAGLFSANTRMLFMHA